MKRTALLTISTCALLAAQAQTDTIDLVPVEVKAVRASATAPFTKTNIRKEEISKQNLGQDLPFILNNTPSVVVNSDAGNGVGYTGIRIRGTDATRINVTLNGVPFNDAESSGTFFVDLPDFLSSVNSIQIQRGVGTSSNGAGAFGATINLSTNDLIKNRVIEINNSYGSFNTLKNTVIYNSGMLGKHFTVDARLSRISSDGYIDRATSDLRSYYLSTAYTSEKTGLRFTTFSGKEKTYQAWNGVSEADLKENRRINYAGMEKEGTPYDNEIDNYRQDHYQLFFNHKLSKGLTFNTGLFLIRGKGYYEQYKADEDYADYNLSVPASGETSSDLVRQLWLDNYYYGNIFSLQYEKEGTAFTLGGAITNYDGNHYGKVIWAAKGLSENKNWYDLDARKSDANVYAKWQQKLGLYWQLYTDLQWRGVTHDIEGFRYNPALAVKQSYNFLNPKAGISYNHNNWLLYTSYGIANKEPNRDDFEAGVTQQPLPERLHDLELGVEKKEKAYNWGATLYYMRYDNQLVLTGKINDVGAYTRTNIKDSYRAGIELQGATRITPWLQAAANLTLSKNKLQNFEEYIDNYDDGTQKQNLYKESSIAFSPSVISSGILTFTPIENTEVQLIGKYIGKQYLDNTENEQRKLDAYYTQDVRVNYTFQKKWLKGSMLVFQLNNIFNTFYEPNGYTFSYYYNNALTTENYYYPMAGANWTVGLNIKL